MDRVIIRKIQPSDNEALAEIVRSVLAEFGANKPGTVFYDPTTDHLYELFQEKNSRYFVAETDGTILGGAGIFPSPGLDVDTCELVKMYLLPAVRGIGLGRSLIQKCIEFAKSRGFRHIYIETMPELKKAMEVYEKFGFHYLKGPLGNTGHFGCEIWMMLDFD
ncbi:MAG: GNAT family N-acetyltransferase [Bacteroidetes bacterium]|nr:MAG: GNAT family N-acetyltransferase [Bacteroidota bacterium]